MQYGAIPESLIERWALAAGLVPIPMLDLMFGVLKSRFLMAGVKLGIFDALAREPQTIESLASGLELDAPSLELLLRSLAFAGYLELDGARYGLSDLSRRSMVTGGVKELTGFAMWNYVQWHYLEHLEALIQTGRGVDFHTTLEDPEAWGYYQKAMLEAARFNAPVLARHIPVRRAATKLLDLAGSHGLMGAAICRKHPPMRSLVIDLPAAISHAEALAHREGISDIVEHRSGDITTMTLGEDSDVVLLSNILHHFLPDQIVALLGRAQHALRGDGTIAIWELERPRRDATPSGGDGVALFFRLTSTASAYSGDEYAGWLAQAGFDRIKIIRPRLSPGSVVVHARKR